MDDITQSRAHELLCFDPATGWLTRRKRIRPSMNARAGCQSNTGYRDIRLDGRMYREHRVIWLMHYGSFPTMELDHINGVRDDNRLENLRQVTRSQNIQNLKRARSDNSNGLLGVSYKKPNKKWAAAIQKDGKKIHIGLYATAQEAHEAYMQVKDSIHINDDMRGFA